MKDSFPNLCEFKERFGAGSPEAEILLEKTASGLAKVFPKNNFSRWDAWCAMEVEAARFFRASVAEPVIAA